MTTKYIPCNGVNAVAITNIDNECAFARSYEGCVLRTYSYPSARYGNTWHADVFDTDPDEMRDYYGIEGVNYAPASQPEGVRS